MTSAIWEQGTDPSANGSQSHAEPPETAQIRSESDREPKDDEDHHGDTDGDAEGELDPPPHAAIVAPRGAGSSRRAE